MRFLSDNARYKLLRLFGPGILSGVTFKHWVKLVAESPLSLDLVCLPRALTITLQSIQTSIWSRRERRFDSLLKDVTIQPPVFVLGHWRSGTTHLHQLLAQDKRFSFPNNFQVSFPHTFLSTQEKFASRANAIIPKRRPMDNMEWDIYSPQEEEFALCTSTLKSNCMGWVFPRRYEHFQKYLTFRDVDPREVAEWRAAFEHFLKKLQLRSPRPLILKSPPHTARIRLLLEMFPAAKFVHIHRHPFAVFQSTRRLMRKVVPMHCLQLVPWEELDERIIHHYRAMHDAFFEDKTKIPAGHFCEVAFEQLEADPVGEVRRIYETLGLPAFDSFEPELRKYVATLVGYQKNQFPNLPAELKARLKREWERCFEEWGYSITEA